MLVPNGFQTIEHDGFVSSYQRQLNLCSYMFFLCQIHLCLISQTPSCNHKSISSLMIAAIPNIIGRLCISFAKVTETSLLYLRRILEGFGAEIIYITVILNY
ncbi:hypothetical protein Bca4012_090058 [Brassica carinata]